MKNIVPIKHQSGLGDLVRAVACREVIDVGIEVESDLLARFRPEIIRRNGGLRGDLRLRCKRCTQCNAQGKNGQTHGLEFGQQGTCNVQPAASNPGLLKVGLALSPELYDIC